MHWPQRPDLTETALDVDLRADLADDFRCTQTGPITDIHIWGGFLQDFVQAEGVGNLAFEVTLYADIPATPDRWSRPGATLWQRVFGPGDYGWRPVSHEPVAWLEPISDSLQPNDHIQTFQFNFCIEDDPFVQKEGTVYWLGVRAQNAAGVFSVLGWRATLPSLQWNDAAVFRAGGNWLPMSYPEGHEFEGKLLDLAFVITGQAEPGPGADLGDAPDSTNSWGNTGMTAYPAGPVPAAYPTVFGAGSPPHGPLHHSPEAYAFLGQVVTSEVEADLGPDADSTNNILPKLDAPNRDGGDDALSLPLVLPECQETTFDYDVTVVAPVQPEAYVNVWFDWNRDGDWNDRVVCPDGVVIPEWAVQNQAVSTAAAGTFTQTTPPFRSVHPLSQDERNPLWMRITLAERKYDPTALTHGGAGPSSGYRYGETEDYYIFPKLTPEEPRLDWGDAPVSPLAAGYPTLAVNNGARHVPEGPWFGDAWDKPDGEPDGQPDVNAFGDDLDTLYPALGANDDEDGVSVPPLVPGAPGDITLQVNGGGGVVDAWIDYDNDGTWSAAEKIYGGFLPDGVHVITVNVPAGAVSGLSFSRFRISRQGGLAPDGLARDGEVEDHWVHIWERPPDLKWLQLPDVTQHGIDVRLSSVPGAAPHSLADDFECTCTGRVTNIHFWGSWLKDQVGVLDRIRVRFRADDPVGPGGHDPANRFSKPDPGILWERTFSTAEFTVGRYHNVYQPGEWWWDPINQQAIRGGDRGIWEVNIKVDPNEAFQQKGTPNKPIIYWLEIQVVAHEGDFGWKTRRWPDHFMDDAVLGVSGPVWWELRYPPQHPYHDKEQDSIDLAFYLTCRPEPDDVPTFRPVSVTSCPPIATVCPTVITRCPPRPTWCRPVRTVCPPAATKCPPVQTRCPPKRTRCPSLQTRCPMVRTACPPVATLCPPVTTRCPTVRTQCPPTETECYLVQTQCPPVETECPPLTTRCPPLVTECLVKDTTCPPLETRCPPAETQCPPVETECPPTETRCPPRQTACPPATTKCPPTETQCNAQDTVCPPVETECPATETKCPPVQTECPPVQTRCPPVQTRCPAVSTRCPPSQTRCPMTVSECLVVETQCPPRETSCPPVETECPTKQTACPATPTRCPPVRTQCPPTISECQVLETECPPRETSCPPVETECPTKQTACPPAKTRCPPILTRCPPTASECLVLETECPPQETSCPPVETECPTKLTVCPPVPTRCPAVATECLIQPTTCPAQLTGCPPAPTQCGIVLSACPAAVTQCPTACDPTVGGVTTRAAVWREVPCPIVEADCPRVPSLSGLGLQAAHVPRRDRLDS